MRQTVQTLTNPTTPHTIRSTPSTGIITRRYRAQERPTTGDDQKDRINIDDENYQADQSNKHGAPCLASYKCTTSEAGNGRRFAKKFHRGRYIGCNALPEQWLGSVGE
jgi:hypothetical protein